MARNILNEFETEIQRYAAEYYGEFKTNDLDTKWSETAYQTLSTQFPGYNLRWRDVYTAIQVELNRLTEER